MGRLRESMTTLSVEQLRRILQAAEAAGSVRVGLQGAGDRFTVLHHAADDVDWRFLVMTPATAEAGGK